MPGRGSCAAPATPAQACISEGAGALRPPATPARCMVLGARCMRSCARHLSFGVTKILISSRARKCQNAHTHPYPHPDPTLTLFYQPGPLGFGHRAPGPCAQSLNNRRSGRWVALHSVECNSPLASTRRCRCGAQPRSRHTMHTKHALQGGPVNWCSRAAAAAGTDRRDGARSARTGTRRNALHARRAMAHKRTPAARAPLAAPASRP